MAAARSMAYLCQSLPDPPPFAKSESESDREESIQPGDNPHRVEVFLLRPGWEIARREPTAFHRSASGPAVTSNAPSESSE